MGKRLLLEILGLAAFATGIGTLVTTAMVIISVLFSAAGFGQPPKGEAVLGTLIVFDVCLLIAFFLARYTRILLR
jgi:hypothetical protein